MHLVIKYCYGMQEHSYDYSKDTGVSPNTGNS